MGAGSPPFSPAEALGLYVHIPFCVRRCPYCDFNTSAGLDDRQAAYVTAVCREMRDWSARIGDRVVETVYLGGGTPTVLPVPLLERLLTAVRRGFRLVPDVEITCEANPGTVDRDRFAALRHLGVNRLSLGVQSFDDGELRFLGRIHDVADVTVALAAARRGGFENVSLDLMFGLPGQAASTWRHSLEQALACGPEHLSLYSLTVEPGTPFFDQVARGAMPPPDDDAAADLYELAMERLSAAGYLHYEVSNWARRAAGDDVDGPAAPTRACRHNLRYWRNGDYLGVGAGAHGHLGATGPSGTPRERRWANVRSIDEYVRRAGSGEGVEDFAEEPDPAQAMGETMMLGLRLLREGVTHGRFHTRHGRMLTAVFADELAELADWDLVTLDDGGVRLTRRGLMLGNQVFARFLPLPREDPGATPVAAGMGNLVG